MPGKLPERWLPLSEFQTWDWTPPETVIAPWLPVGGLALLYGAGGVGKTYLSLACAMSIAEGRSRVPRMHVPRPRRVLYVDGEMQPSQFSERFTKLSRAAPFDGKAAERFAILTHAAFRDGMPDLSQPGRGQDLVWSAAQEHRADVIFLDNVSAIIQTGSPNDEEAMRPFLLWLLKFRRAGLSCVVVHHTGHRKSDEDGPAHARGTSSFNDKVDSAIWVKGERGISKECIPVRLVFTKHRFFVPSNEKGELQSCCFDEADTRCWFREGGADPEAPEWLSRARELHDKGWSNRRIAADEPGMPSYVTIGKWLKEPTLAEMEGKMA